MPAPKPSTPARPTPKLGGPIARLLAVIDRIRTAFADALPEPTPETIAAACRALAAWAWLYRVSDGVTRLADQMAAGILKPLRAHPRTRLSLPRGAKAYTLPLPRGAAWLSRSLPEPEPLADALAELLADPGLQPLLAQEPARFGRLLRPLCHAMGLTPPGCLRATPGTPSPQTATPPAKPAKAAKPVRAAPPPPAPQSPGAASLSRIGLAAIAPALSRRSEFLLGVFPLRPKFAFP